MRRSFVIVGAGLMVACASFPPSSASPVVAQPLPEFVQRSVNANLVDTRSLTGRVTVLHFFGEPCARCDETLLTVQQLHQNLDDIAFVGIARGRPIDVLKTLERDGVTFPVIRDEERMLARLFHVNGFPSTFVVDRKGIVRWAGGPEHGEEAIEKAVYAARDMR